MKNRIAFKLTLYFASVLLVFALIIGGLFYEFFRQQTVDMKKRDMRMQAQRIAEVISDNMEFLEQRYGSGISNSRFLNYLDNVTQEIVWVVDSERRLNVNEERRQRRRQAPPPQDAFHEQRNERPRKQDLLPPPTDAKEAYDRLPPHIREKVEEGFAGKSFIVEDYNDWLYGVMLTVGGPVYDKNGQIKAVVLLHSPVRGLYEAIWAGLRILLVCILVALALGVILSVVLSWRFTRPLQLMRNNAERLAERNYQARNDVRQDDEIGELAQTLDILAERLQLADEESQKLEKLRREFIANISHELRTPVTVIRGSLEALRDGVVTEESEVTEFHEQMYKESVFLQRLINDLLDLSRLQNTDFPIEKAPLNLCGVIRDAARGARQLGKGKNLRIETLLDTEHYMLSGDYGRLRQMLMIFLDNSVKFSPAGSSIELRLTGSKLEVTDHGCGMKPEDVPYAFERFYKARNEQNKNGSGLGLAIAKQIALRHDMRLELVSETGFGTTITILLPPQIEMGDNDDGED